MPVDADELLETIAENVSNPASASGDQGSVTMHSLSDQMAVQKAIAGKNAATNGLGGLLRQQLKPPSALGT